MPETYPQDRLAKHYLKRRPERKNRRVGGWTMMQKATRIHDKVSPTVDRSGTKKQRAVERNPKERNLSLDPTAAGRPR
ncbi:hypothetical protein ElyMa_006092800 [Elysia marginata]|uniref:Uncharacterized protein n=1 Tax=Elysia marginata TaxID=1093978 RepID=A0AAV4GSS3_9GAST|nr:hypothetical protein ElyMa_006092800 [Elysia marginata]